MVQDKQPVLLQQNINGTAMFDRNWNDFRAGIGTPDSSYWLGNEMIHELTAGGGYEALFQLQSRDDLQWYWARYAGVNL